MYGKIFKSVFEGTMRGKRDVLLVWMNLIVNADKDGYIDRTFRVIADETGMPLDDVKNAILELESPDTDSRSQELDGRRLERMDGHRNWGWRIVNHSKYSAIKNEEDRREQNRIAQAKLRAKIASNSKQASASVSKISQASAESAYVAVAVAVDEKEDKKETHSRPMVELVQGEKNQQNQGFQENEKTSESHKSQSLCSTLSDIKLNGGYVLIYHPYHPNANSEGFVREHRLVVEKSLGKPIPATSIVHHIDGNKANNKTNNLVLCQDIAYHNLLHQRQRALDACGNANYLKCTLCHEYDLPENLNNNGYHDECKAIPNERAKEKRKQLKNADNSETEETKKRQKVAEWFLKYISIHPKKTKRFIVEQIWFEMFLNPSLSDQDAQDLYTKIITTLRVQKDKHPRDDTNYTYFPAADAWLRDGRWMDEVETKQPETLQEQADRMKKKMEEDEAQRKEIYAKVGIQR